MNVIPAESIPAIEKMTIIQIAKEFGLMNLIYYSLIKTGLLPPLIFMGVGAMTDFTLKEAGALGIIGGADGPTAIYTSIILAPHLLGPIAIAAYSYMALVPIIIPFVVKFSITKKELLINMKEQDKLFPTKRQINDLRTAKIMFPILLGLIVTLLVPSSAPLIGMLLFGNLIKEIGSDTNLHYSLFLVDSLHFVFQFLEEL